MSEQKIFIEKLETLISAYIIERPKNRELIIREGNSIYYKDDSWEYKIHTFNWNLLNSEVQDFATHLVKSKFENSEEWDAILEKISYEISSKGHYNFSFSLENTLFRVNWSIGQWDKSFLRLRRIAQKIPDMKEIWVPEILYEKMSEYRGGGLIIISAPPGSWKSTTIASVINRLASEKTLNIITLEDPVEFIYNNTLSCIEQREKTFNFDSYSSWIEAAMRQDPDIVVIQELTTPDIIRDCMLLVSKWVMVVTTLHTSDTTDIFDALITAFPTEEHEWLMLKLKDNMKFFMSQRLVKSENGKVIPVFEYISNTPDVKWYILDKNHRGLPQIMRQPHCITFDEYFYNLVNVWELSVETAESNCPDSRLSSFKQKLYQ